MRIPKQFIAALTFCLILFFNQKTFSQTFIPFEITDQGHILIKAKVNGVEGNFIFDTGAGMTLLLKKFADKVGSLKKLDGGFTGFRATGERMDLDLYQGNTLRVGELNETNPVLSYIDADFGPIDGLISLMTFKNQPFTIDYTKKHIVLENKSTLAQIKKTGSTVPLQLDISRDKALDISAYFKINNKLNLQLIMDSGAGGNVFRLNSKYLPGLGIDTAKATKSVKPSEVNPNFKTTIYHAKVESISANAAPKVIAKDISVAFIPGLIYDGIVCLNWIGEKITFDLQKSEMIVR